MSHSTLYGLGTTFGITVGVILGVLTQQWWWIGVGVGLGVTVSAILSALRPGKQE